MTRRETKLEALGYSLARVPRAAANYRPLVIDDNVGYLSGAIPFVADSQLAYRGRVPSQILLEDAKKAAALCAANLLRVLHAELGTLDRIERVLKIAGYVNSDPDFTEQHLVMNGASDLLVEVLGEAGRHARSAVGVAQLPLGAAVEIDMVVKLTN